MQVVQVGRYNRNKAYGNEWRKNFTKINVDPSAKWVSQLSSNCLKCHQHCITANIKGRVQGILKGFKASPGWRNGASRPHFKSPGSGDSWPIWPIPVAEPGDSRGKLGHFLAWYPGNDPQVCYTFAQGCNTISDTSKGLCLPCFLFSHDNSCLAWAFRFYSVIFGF